MVSKVHEPFDFETATSMPGPGMEFRVEGALLRMVDDKELERFGPFSWEKVTLYSSCGDAFEKSRNHAFIRSSHLEAPVQLHIHDIVQTTQAEGEFYESDLPGSELTSSSGEEDAAADVAPLLGSLDGFVAQQGFTISYEHWPQDLQVVDWQRPTRQNVVNLVNFFKKERSAAQKQDKAPLLCPVVGCHKKQRRPQALRVSLD